LGSAIEQLFLFDGLVTASDAAQASGLPPKVEA